MNAALWIGDVLALFGALVMTLAVVGLIRLPDTLARLHAAAKAAALGVIILLLNCVLSGDGDLAARAALVIVFLAITAPVASHALLKLEVHTRAAPGEAPKT